MDEHLRQFVEDLEDVAALRLSRYERAEEVVRSAGHVMQELGKESLVPVLTTITEWWDRHYPNGETRAAKADHLVWLSILESVREVAELGS